MPDLNSVPASPHSLATSRQNSTSHPQPAPAPSDSGSLHILPSNQNAVNHASSSANSSQQLATHVGATSQPASSAAATFGPDAGVGPGPGPLRHPRPLTAGELHIQLEKEQEAMVNRLTRELSLLRASQNASVASNASSISVSAANQEPNDDTVRQGMGFAIPAARSSAHHRTSSSASQNHGSHSLSTYETRTHSSRQSLQISLSRQGSNVSRQSQPSTPSITDPSYHFPNTRIPQNAVYSSSVNSNSNAHNSSNSFGIAGQMSPILMPVTSRYEETLFYRNELDSAKRENDQLKARVRELEKLVSERRNSDASRGRSRSSSTAASVNIQSAGGSSIAPPREAGPSRLERERGMLARNRNSIPASIAVGVSEDEVEFGESASSKLDNTHDNGTEGNLS